MSEKETLKIAEDLVKLCESSIEKGKKCPNLCDEEQMIIYEEELKIAKQILENVKMNIGSNSI